jgi:hypothetical protein
MKMMTMMMMMMYGQCTIVSITSREMIVDRQL